jgi:hypothetical protein
MAAALVHAAEDLPASLVVGAAAFDRFLSLPVPQRTHAPVLDRPATQYPVLATQALGQTHIGSSAGGEQPKFTALREGHPVLVKFSPAGEGAVARRWRDLLVCESLTLHTLAGAGIGAAHTPAYGMLPMFHAPVADEVVPRDLPPIRRALG